MFAAVAVVIGSVALTQADYKAKLLGNHVELARAQARSLQDSLTEQLKATDWVVQTLVQSELQPPGPERLQQLVRDMPLLRSLSWLDEHGRVVESSAAENVGLQIDASLFLPVSETPLPTMRVGRPWMGRELSLAAGDNSLLSVSLLRDVRTARGSVQRVMVALNADHVINGYQSQLDDLTATAELWRSDGILLLSTRPNRQGGAQVEASDKGVLAMLAEPEVGKYSQAPSRGDVLTAYRASSAYPLITVVTHSHAALLKPWVQANHTVWMLVGAFLLGSVMLATFFYLRLERAAFDRWQQRQHTRLAASVFTHAQEAIFITDLNGSILSVNEAFCSITGYNAEEVLGKNPSVLSSGRQSTAFYAEMWRALGASGHWVGEIWNRRKSGEVFAELINITAVPDESGKPVNYVAMFQDISQQKSHDVQLKKIAHFDVLTGLPNRVLLVDRMQQALSQVQRRGNLMGVVFIDIDHFKYINDSYGLPMGDQLLTALAQRLRDSLRDGDTLARLGGDEFVAVLVDLPDVHECEIVLERLLAAASQPIVLSGQAMQVSASVGAALYPQDGTQADTLLRHADQAMYQAKLGGKNRYQLFDVAQDISIRKRGEGRTRIARGLVQGEFVLHFQPKVHLRQGLVVGAEALVRWQDPRRGLLAPGLFFPDIEGHVLSAQLGDWVLSTALAQMDEWQRAGIHMPLSVNISAYHLQRPHFAQRLTELLRAHPNVAPSDLELEIWETSALEDISLVSNIMRECLALGVNFALDDFGTGYASLTYLRRLPASVLKIDQRFIRDMLSSKDDLSIVQAVIGLAKSFGRSVIAEGVETRAQGDQLQRLGCDNIQGYGVARPMPAKLLPGWAVAWQAEPRWTSSAG